MRRESTASPISRNCGFPESTLSWLHDSIQIKAQPDAARRRPQAATARPRAMMGATRAFAQTRPSLAGRTVLQILPRLDAGGAERTTLDVAAAIVQAGGRALVACDGGRQVSE